MAKLNAANDEARLQELSAIPQRERTQAEEREYGKLHARRSRRKARAEQIASTANSRPEFWESNRTALSPQELASMLTLHQRVEDILFWMEHGHELDPTDEDFVSLESGVADLLEFMREHGTARLGYIKADQDIPADWSTREFWRSSELLTKLCDENYPTAQYVRYGLHAALPDWLVANFLTGRAGWSFEKVNALLGRVVTKENGMVYEGAAQ